MKVGGSDAGASQVDTWKNFTTDITLFYNTRARRTETEIILLKETSNKHVYPFFYGAAENIILNICNIYMSQY